MPTTILDGETLPQAYARRFAEEAETDARIAKQTHTPGPWCYVKREGVTDSGVPYVVFEVVPDCSTGWKNGRYLCMSGCIDEGDARLIAAAPDLLEFAEEVRRTGDTRLANMAIAVLAKTKGGAQ